MKIVEACFTSALGGLELYCLNSAKHLQERGHQVQLWLAERGRAANHPITSEIETLLFREPFYFDPNFLYRARNILRKQKIDVVHLHRTKDLGALAWIGGIAYVLSLQIDSTRKKKDLYHRFVFSRTAKLLTITKRMKRLAESNLGIRAEKIHTLYHGIDSAALSLRRDKNRLLRESMGILPEAVVFGIIGRLEWGKGQWVLLKALQQIQDDYPEAHLLIVGEPPPEGAGFDTELKRMAEEVGIADRTHFTGFLMDTAAAYSALDVCVLASKKESFGLVLLEAMAFGLPIIATNAGGVPEIIEHEVNGLLVNSEDPDDMAKAIKRLLDAPELRRQLGENGRRIVQDKFSLARHMDDLEGYFKSAIDRTQGSRTCT